jgi:hypothetical protein
MHISRFGAGGTLDLKGGGLRPSRRTQEITSVSGLEDKVIGKSVGPAPPLCARHCRRARDSFSTGLMQRNLLNPSTSLAPDGSWMPFWYLMAVMAAECAIWSNVEHFEPFEVIPETPIVQMQKMDSILTP